MKIAVYMSDFIYKYGGAEGYAANLISVLQNIFKNDIITIITECYKNDGLITEAQFADKQNKAYGLQIKPDFIKIRYINAKKAENICKENKILDTIQFIKRQNSFLKLQKQIKEISKTFDLFISCVARWRCNEKLCYNTFPEGQALNHSDKQKNPVVQIVCQKTRQQLCEQHRFVHSKQ